eukprot:CFRG1180T1
MDRQLPVATTLSKNKSDNRTLEWSSERSSATAEQSSDTTEPRSKKQRIDASSLSTVKDVSPNLQKILEDDADDLDCFEDILFDGKSRPQDKGRVFLDALIPYVNSPEKFPAEVFHVDKACVVVRDKFAKAKFHYLVIPKRSIDYPSNLTPKDISLFKHLHARAQWVIKKLKEKHSELSRVKFRTGIHSVPSIRQLHIHVISQDFVSAALKNKKHWNSFTTDYFVDSDKVLHTLQTTGEVKYNVARMEVLLKNELRCHLCSQPQKNMPSLKAHIQAHDTQ